VISSEVAFPTTGRLSVISFPNPLRALVASILTFASPKAT